MREKVLDRLLKATCWLTPQHVANQVGARSASNISVYLKHLEAGGEAVSRTRSEGGIAVTEYRHRSKMNEDCAEVKRSAKQKPAIAAIPEEELTAWRKMAGTFDIDTPRAMSVFIGKLQRKTA